MIEYSIKKIDKTYTEQFYITLLYIDVIGSDIDVKVKTKHRHIIKKESREDTTNLLIEVYSKRYLSSIKIELIDLKENKDSCCVKVNSKETNLKILKSFIKKDVLRRVSNNNKNMFSDCYGDLYYSLDHIELLPNYNLVKVSGWCFSKKDKFQLEGKDKVSLLGVIDYKREDVSELYKTNKKTGFEAIYRLIENTTRINFVLKSDNIDIEFLLNKKDFDVIHDLQVQRIKAEQYYNSSPYVMCKERQIHRVDKSDKTVDLLVACNDEKWLLNIFQQAAKIGNVNLIIAANDRFKDTFTSIKVEKQTQCEMFFCDSNSKNELILSALKRAQGDYCLFFEQEDELDHNIITYLRSLFLRDIKVVCSDYDLKYNDQNIVRVVRKKESWNAENPELSLISCMIETDLIKNATSFSDVIRIIKETGKKRLHCGNSIHYHYNCVENSWDNIDNIKQIAFYLTQYHENDENNKWWGKGFTEWTNVKSGTAKFDGHHQPRMPGELGYYDLVEDKDILYKQTKLAREYGVDGFCFYYYWFNGKRLLKKPLDIFLNNKDIDFNYCICWANESWTRRWDGLEQEILMEQVHNETTDIEFIYDVIPMFKDDRYIKINGKPLLLVYRMELFPNPVETIDRWRKICRKENVGEIHVSIVQSFAQVFPEQYGADSATEFPPHKVNMAPNICINADVHSKVPEFQGNIYSYEKTVKNLSNIVMRDYNLMQGSMLEWDNTARRKNNSNVFCEFSPELFKIWNIKNRFYTRLYNYEQGNCTFINAWNEWAEGSYLEPDEKYGRLMLETIKEVSKIK